MSTKLADASAPSTATLTTCGWCSVRDCDACRPAGTGWVCVCAHEHRLPRSAFEAVLAGGVAAGTDPISETTT
jgi:hypothetical protein